MQRMPSFVPGSRHFLSRAAQALAADALTFSETLEATIAAAIPELGDFGFIEVFDGERLRCVALAQQDDDVGLGLKKISEAREAGELGTFSALRSGVASLHLNRDAGAADVELVAYPDILSYGVESRSAITVPMHYRGELIGAITLFMGGSGRTHTLDDLACAEELAMIASPIVVNSRLVEQHINARTALQRSEEFLRTATEAGELGLWEWDIPGDRITCSERLYHMHGLPADSPARRSGDFIALVHPDDIAHVNERREAALAGEADYVVEFRPIRPDGRVSWLSARAHIFRDQLGKPVRMIGATIDITSRMEMLARERILRAEAEQARQVAEEASRARDEFLAMLGHELRNPLAPIVTNLRLMELRGDGEFRAERRVIERQVSNLSRLVDDLLDVARITRGHVQLRKQRVSLHDVLTRAVETVTPLVEVRQHRLELDVPSPSDNTVDLIFDADEDRLVQVFCNLLTNAARYTPEGGEIRLHAKADGGTCQISVIDNGQGIAKELLPRVFELFFQGTHASDRASGGLGIGLALVKNLVGLHGGTVAAYSDGPGLGSSFVVTLPLCSSQEPRMESSLIPAAPVTSLPRRILLVDDNRDALESLAELLKMNGHDVRTAGDPVSAMALAACFDAEIAILDIGLPGIDGYELGARMRASGSACRLVALTGYGLAEDRAKSQASGFETHFVKPIDSAALLAFLAG